MEIETSGERERRFSARRSVRNTVIFFLGFGVFTVLGLGLLIFGERIGFLFIVFSTAFLALLVFVTLKPGWAYFIDPSGITVKRTFRSVQIPRVQIGELRLLTDREAVALIYPDQAAEAESTSNLNVVDAFRAQRRVGEKIGFSSVPIVLSETRSGGPLTITSVGASTSGDFVLVVTVEGKVYLLSPKEPKGFIEAFRSLR